MQRNLSQRPSAFYLELVSFHIMYYGFKVRLITCNAVLILSLFTLSHKLFNKNVQYTNLLGTMRKVTTSVQE